MVARRLANKDAGRFRGVSLVAVACFTCLVLLACGGEGDANGVTSGVSDGGSEGIETDASGDVDTSEPAGPISEQPTAGMTEEPSGPVTEEPLPSDPLEIVPGERMGPVALGMTLAEVVDLLGEPATVFGQESLFFGRYPSVRLEVLFASPSRAELVEGSTVISVGTLAGGTFSGPVVPGDALADALDVLAEGADRTSHHAVDPSGFSLEHDDETVARVAVLLPWTSRPQPPEMQPASTTMPGEE